MYFKLSLSSLATMVSSKDYEV